MDDQAEQAIRKNLKQRIYEYIVWHPLEDAKVIAKDMKTHPAILKDILAEMVTDNQVSMQTFPGDPTPLYMAVSVHNHKVHL